MERHGGSLYGSGYQGRLVRPENLRHLMLKRRGILRRRYAVGDITRLLEWVAADIERRQQYEQKLLATIQQLGEENHQVKLALRQWQSQQTRADWEAMHPAKS